MKTDYQQVIPESWADTARIFTALGDEHRQRILLLFDPGEQLTISQIVAITPLSRTAVSHHLQVLRAAELLTSEKRGKEVFLSINADLLLRTFTQMADFVQAQQSRRVD
ncbi:MAG TPA: metalloregulator ArsR/SmtB family transcription factor [Halothiobacillus sp.]|nr:metalloregulator ArsR/SmtB family transcription factor [Halothiobacillus sp.]